jgi:midasin (ATPase involved in ribosome maturation)
MKVKFFEHDGVEKKYETDLQVVPRKGDWFIIDEIRGIITDVIWHLNRYVDDRVTIYYMTPEERKVQHEKEQQGRLVK